MIKVWRKHSSVYKGRREPSQRQCPAAWGRAKSGPRRLEQDTGVPTHAVVPQSTEALPGAVRRKTEEARAQGGRRWSISVDRAVAPHPEHQGSTKRLLEPINSVKSQDIDTQKSSAFFIPMMIFLRKNSESNPVHINYPNQNGQE